MKFHGIILYQTFLMVLIICVLKSGLEIELREKAPHLLDIDGGVCHHIHNTVKKFWAPFKKNFREVNGQSSC